jgi:hypothetical protein
LATLVWSIVIVTLLVYGPTTVKPCPVALTPLWNTTTFPVVAPVGTVVTRLVALQLVTVAVVPLKVTVPEPCVAPKFVPVIVTAAPTAPVVTERLVTVGVGSTVNVTPLLATLETVTTTGPVVVPAATVTPMLVEVQLVTVADVPLNVIVLLP